MKAVVLLFLLLAGCATAPQPPRIEEDVESCPKYIVEYQDGEVLAWLNRVTQLLQRGCYSEAATLGRHLRDRNRDKHYSVIQETASVFVPDEYVSPYVLESYERVYLSVLIATSYLSLGNRLAAEIELRRAESEARAVLYNFGSDPVGLLMLAALWDNLGQFEISRPYWQKLRESLPNDDPIVNLADGRLRAIDSSASLSAPWKIYGIGQLPDLEWDLRLLAPGSGFYEVTSKDEFLASCASGTGALISTKPWIVKLSQRYNSDYHPFLNAKNWVRLPVGMAYGAATFTGGLMVISGCLDKNSAGNCGAYLQTGIELIKLTPSAMAFGVRPDLRHWKQVPLAIMITSADSPKQESCLQKTDLVSDPIEILKPKSDARTPAGGSR